MYKDLLLAVDTRDANAICVDYGIKLAKRFDAHLTGLYLIPEFAPPATVGIYLTTDINANVERHERQQADAVIAGFRDTAEREGVAFDTRTDRCHRSEFADRLAIYGRYADAVIIGQPDDDDSAGDIQDPGDTLLTCGAPVIVVPHIGAPATTAERVMIAWNVSRESARAVRDAMPLLEQAKAVDVVCIRPKMSEAGHGDMPGTDIALHLARHGIQVEVEIVESKDIDVGNAILSHLADRGSDILVMGGYGHSRMREFILGGATRTILQSMTVPVLMAH
ncbi:MAG: universal stress protein [Geminicoccaceae bacterium]